MLSTQILSGWAMTSAIAQHALPEIDRLSLDITDLQRRRDRLVDGLRACGYDVMRPEGAFYVTPRAPIADDVVFSDMLAREGVLCLPGSVVHLGGYVRASITASETMIDRALPVFARVRERALASPPAPPLRSGALPQLLDAHVQLAPSTADAKRPHVGAVGLYARTRRRVHGPYRDRGAA